MCGPFLSSPEGCISNMLNFQLVDGRGEGVDEVLYIYVHTSPFFGSLENAISPSGGRGAFPRFLP